MSLGTIARDWPPRPQAGVPHDTTVTTTGMGTQPTGFEMLTRYIPTETITLYVGAMAAKAELATLLHLQDASWAIYWFFAAVTPALLLLLLLNKHRTSGSADPFKPPWWPFVAAALAYLMWAMSVPGNPIADQLKALPAFGALFLSVILSLLDPVLGPKPPKA